MKKVFRAFQYLLIAGGFCLSIFPNYSSAQTVNEKGSSDFFDGTSEEKPSNSSTKNDPPKILDFFLKPEPKSENEGIQEIEIAPNPQDALKTKEMVEVPSSLTKAQLDASDFEDPFYRVRGLQENSEKVLQPGTTIGGVQFQSYRCL